MVNVRQAYTRSLEKYEKHILLAGQTRRLQDYAFSRVYNIDVFRRADAGHGRNYVVLNATAKSLS